MDEIQKMENTLSLKIKNLKVKKKNLKFFGKNKRKSLLVKEIFLFFYMILKCQRNEYTRSEKIHFAAVEN